MKTSVAFYNTENLFYPSDEFEKFDNEYTPKGKLKWTQKRYQNKIWKISSVISMLGLEQTGDLPWIVGLAEIENEKVLSDLVRSEHLKDYHYDFIHFESLDERGIDNALIYRKEKIELVDAQILRQSFERESDRTDYTRDGLFAKFKLNQKELIVFVVHLPSRRDNELNREFRNQIMQSLRLKIDELLNEDPMSQIILMGDFNLNPNDEDMKEILKTTGNLNFDKHELYNPMMNFKKNTGSLKHEGQWILFDQILFSKSFFENQNDFNCFESAHIYQDQSVRDWNKKHKGSPFRTYAGTKYLGGYSDHFPVYAILNH